MLSKTRTVIPLVAAFGLSGASMVPAAALAAPNTGGYQKSSEAIKQKAQTNRCADLKVTEENWVSMAELDVKAGRTADAEKDLENAQEQTTRAQNIGCGWAAQIAPPRQPAVPVSSGHPTALP